MEKSQDYPKVNYGKILAQISFWINPVSLESILQCRTSRYGRFVDVARISLELKEVVDNQHAANRMKEDQLEALYMICHKMARILNGDCDYSDSWRDIAGYATLVADRLEGIDNDKI